MPFPRPRTKSTAYTHSPPLLPAILKAIQAISSAVVAGITFYFLSELRRDGYSLPWTFILLLTVSLLTLLTLALPLCLNTRTTSTTPQLLISGLTTGLAAFWAVSFALLAWWSAPALGSACARESWDSDTGTGVCRMYKALFSFALFGTLGACVAAGWQWWGVRKERAGRGRFVGLQGEVDDGIWDLNVPRGAPVGVERGREGYQLPEEQWGYADTGYGGAGEAVGRRSVEGRM
ncbi:hypothetical protein E8E13_007852 [Curvularia kusanoi]|uniref:MARVEL domain-containing protein n=1 Tax=Curvularia kusanoi TaxID=90978 RepID=A0A9P4TAM5_CURKU|nr:hypothetical protein E8E13_007852 [Curvularia kusanoi]